VQRLQPGRIVQQDDGSLLAPDFGDTYASRAGAIEQSRAVFLAGCDLPARLTGRMHTVLETGFGTGLNALALAHVAGGAAATCQIHYIGIEGHPLSRDDLTVALAPYDGLAVWREALIAGWPPLMEGIYRWSLGPRFTLTLALGEALATLRELEVAADSVFLDGFAPDRNPAMWSPELLTEVVAHCRAGAHVAGWCVAGEVRRALEAAGCCVERKPGFGGKRERLEAVVLEGQQLPPTAEAGQQAIPDRALVIGAGIAGASAAAALAARGIAVTVMDTAGAAAGASGNPVGVVRPEPSGLDHPISRLTALGTLWLRRWLQARGDAPPHVRADRCGALRLPRDDKHARRLREHAEASPPDWMRWMTADEAAAVTGQNVAGDGVWIAEAWSAVPPDLVAALLATPGIGLVRGAVKTVEVVKADPPRAPIWRVTRDDGSSADWPLVIVANAFGVSGHLPIPCRRVRGQLSWAGAEPSQALGAIVCREGYVTPAIHGRHIVGATFQRDDTDLAPRAEDDETNRWRLARLLPEWEARQLQAACVSVRAATPDRLPLVGRLALGLYASLGHGSRGLTCAPLCGELLASMVCGEPLPLPRDLVRRIDPLRFGDIEAAERTAQSTDVRDACD
jgi:tRNA 5-methylaminomethyl-2-thiouridine biosynthesis bifunctional protein